MGRVLPGLTTRTGAVSVADRLGTTSDQKLQNALRRAAFQKAEERKTPEGMLKFIGQAAQTAGQVAGALDKAGTLIGKLPLSDALRNAAAAKASKKMVMPQVRETVEEVAGATGLGEGAPVTPQTAEMIRQTSLQGPQGRVAAQALGAEAAQDIAMRQERGLSAAAESELDRRTQEMRQNIVPGRLGYTSEMLLEAADRELQAGARDINVAMEIAKDKMAERAAEVSMGAETAQRGAEQEAVGAALSEVSPVTRADEEEIQLDMFVESLGETPLDRQEKLLSLAQGAMTPADQANILKAVDRMEIAPGPTVSDLFDPKGAYKRQLRAAFPDLGKIEQERLRTERAMMRDVTQRRGQDLTAGARKRSAEVREKGIKSADERAEAMEARQARRISEDARQFNATHNFKWAQLRSREKMAKAANDSREKVANIRRRRRGGRGGLSNKQLQSAITSGIRESINREKEVSKALRGARAAVKDYEERVIKEEQRIREIMADPRKSVFIGDTFDDQGRSKTLVQLNEGLENAQKLVTKLDRVSAEMREASDRYKKLRTRYFKNPKDKELLDEYVKAEDAVSGLISSYLEVLDDAGSE